MLDDFLRLSGSFAASGGFLHGYSEEHKKFLSSGYKCPECGKTLLNRLGFITVNFYSKDGARIPLAVGQISGEIVECPNCNHRWNMRGKSNPSRPNKLELVSIIETHRSEEILGTEQRLIDNSQSTSKTTRKFTVSREWSKSYSIQYENTQVNGTELNLGLKFPEIEVASIKVTSQETLKKQYSISEGTKENYTEEVQVEVLESIKLNLIFRWKRIWQNGFIKLRSQDNTELNVPFKVVVGMTFDQSLVNQI
jgi:ssDNA-binding Zn-finger/Zn-ribbon topoisomerase 1